MKLTREEIDAFVFDVRTMLNFNREGDAASRKLSILRDMALASLTARNEALEEAAKWNCPYCRAGAPLENGKHLVDDGLQPKGNSYRTIRCAGEHIRAFKEKDNG